MVLALACDVIYSTCTYLVPQQRDPSNAAECEIPMMMIVYDVRDIT